MVDQSGPTRRNVLLMAVVIAICVVAFLLSVWFLFIRPDQGDDESLRIGSTTYTVTLADSDSERIHGLSDTKYLADDQAMVFWFDRDDQWNMWMKDMRYSIDMVWVDSDNTVVHIERNVAPETYPERFTSPRPARYVVELAAGQTDVNGLKIGDTIDMTELTA